MQYCTANMPGFYTRNFKCINYILFSQPPCKQKPLVVKYLFNIYFIPDAV